MVMVPPAGIVTSEFRCYNKQLLRLVSSKNIKWYFGIRVNFDINQDVNQLMYLVDVKIRLFGFICYFVNPFHVSSLLKKEDGTLFNDLFGVTS